MISLNYFATADSGLATVMKATPVEMIVIYNNKIKSIRKSINFSKDQLGSFATEKVISNRIEKIKEIDCVFKKEKLIKELDTLFSIDRYFLC